LVVLGFDGKLQIDMPGTVPSIGKRQQIRPRSLCKNRQYGDKRFVNMIHWPQVFVCVD
ncbi:MAG: hypothetical protein ACI945_001600, partial [Pseudohongiellaceae bacterium]